MKEKPILFNTAMVQAILSGQKTQTRRVLDCTHPVVTGFEPNGSHGYWKGTAKSEAVIQQYISTFPLTIKCPFGMVGERLWVREAWSTHAEFDGIAARNLTTRSVHYWADGPCRTGKKRPSTHMPRWASRLLLEITAVRVERLNDISKADATKEGGPKGHPSIDKVSLGLGFKDWPRSWFAQTWDWVNKIHTWAANPWVWVIEFKVIEPTDKA